jgi:hypothetical protein
LHFGEQQLRDRTAAVRAPRRRPPLAFFTRASVASAYSRSSFAAGLEFVEILARS